MYTTSVLNLFMISRSGVSKETFFFGLNNYLGLAVLRLRWILPTYYPSVFNGKILFYVIFTTIVFFFTAEYYNILYLTDPVWPGLFYKHLRHSLIC